MEPIKIQGNPRKYIDGAGKPRWLVVLKNGQTTTKARWIMMNFLHTEHIPKKIHIHHIDEITDHDVIENLELLTQSQHAKFHIPRDESRFGISATDDPIAYGRLNANEWYCAHRENPDFLEKRKERKREYTNKKKQDPEWREKNAAYSREYRKIHKDDPVFREKNRVYCHDYYHNKSKENKNETC